MADRSFLSWPFFEPRHRELADDVRRWCGHKLPEQSGDLDADCRTLVSELGQAGFEALLDRVRARRTEALGDDRYPVLCADLLRLMLVVTALLGVAPPVRRILKMNASQALRPRVLEDGRGHAFGRRTSP